MKRTQNREEEEEEGRGAWFNRVSKSRCVSMCLWRMGRKIPWSRREDRKRKWNQNGSGRRTAFPESETRNYKTKKGPTTKRRPCTYPSASCPIDPLKKWGDISAEPIDRSIGAKHKNFSIEILRTRLSSRQQKADWMSSRKVSFLYHHLHHRRKGKKNAREIWIDPFSFEMTRCRAASEGESNGIGYGGGGDHFHFGNDSLFGLGWMQDTIGKWSSSTGSRCLLAMRRLVAAAAAAVVAAAAEQLSSITKFTGRSSNCCCCSSPDVAALLFWHVSIFFGIFWVPFWDSFGIFKSIS